MSIVTVTIFCFGKISLKRVTFSVPELFVLKCQCIKWKKFINSITVIIRIKGRNSVVGTGTRYELDVSGFES